MLLNRTFSRLELRPLDASAEILPTALLVRCTKIIGFFFSNQCHEQTVKCVQYPTRGSMLLDVPRTRIKIYGNCKRRIFTHCITLYQNQDFCFQISKTIKKKWIQDSLMTVIMLLWFRTFLGTFDYIGLTWNGLDINFVSDPFLFSWVI
jgi:hypothetical protein